MSFLRIRRKKLQCFYCSHLVAIDSLPPGGIETYPSGRPSRFNCPDCCADNHLDEKGEIVDFVPESPPKPAPVYARRRTSPRASHHFSTRSATPESPASTSPTTQTPFCRTCANNQKVVTDAIAAYPLPPEDHPDYDEVVTVQFPKYRAKLEERWPQVCTLCAPRVNERIRNSNYQVKVASLGQMLARTNGYEAAKKAGAAESEGKKNVETAVWVARGMVWCYFHVLMVVWHGAALVQPEVAMEMETGVASWGSCVLRSVVAGEIDVHCYGAAAEQARWIPWSLLGFFWIYRERGLQKAPHKKLVGSKEYFKLEMGIYVFRMLCWYFAAPGAVALTKDAFTAVHLGLFFLSFMSTLFSITCLKLEDPPAFSLREPEPVPGTPSPPASPQPMTSAVPRHPMSPTTPLRPGTNNPPPSTGSTFYSPVKRVRAASPTPLPRRGTPTSPDVMDWNPTTAQETNWQISSQRLPPPPQPSFTATAANARANANAAQLQRQNQYTRAASPFSGSLPPAPRAPAQRIVSSLMHPQVPAQPTPPNQISREQFFSHRLNPAPSAPPTGQEFSKVAAPGYRLGNPQYPPMAPQRFFVADEATGLESLMAGGFRLEDEPEVVAERASEETWWVVATRVVMVMMAGAAIVYGGEYWGVVGGLVVVAGAVVWRVRSWDVRAVEIGVVGFVLAVAAAGVARERVRKGAEGVVLIALVGEAWGVMMRMQRGRARRFYEEERRRGIEEEKEARRRAGSVESAGRGKRAGGLGGLSLG